MVRYYRINILGRYAGQSRQANLQNPQTVSSNLRYIGSFGNDLAGAAFLVHFSGQQSILQHSPVVLGILMSRDLALRLVLLRGNPSELHIDASLRVNTPCLDGGQCFCFLHNFNHHVGPMLLLLLTPNC